MIYILECIMLCLTYRSVSPQSLQCHQVYLIYSWVHCNAKVSLLLYVRTLCDTECIRFFSSLASLLVLSRRLEPLGTFKGVSTSASTRPCFRWPKFYAYTDLSRTDASPLNWGTSFCRACWPSRARFLYTQALTGQRLLRFIWFLCMPKDKRSSLPWSNH